jgi:hypothetical protein
MADAEIPKQADLDLTELKRLNERVAKLSRGKPLRWEGRIGHARQVLSGLRALLEDLGFTAVSSLDDSQGAIRDVSYFEGIVIGKKEASRLDFLAILFGLITLPLLLGFWVLGKASIKQRALIALYIEGESYLTGARGEDAWGGGQVYAERTGVIGDVRLAVRSIHGPPSKTSEFEVRRAGRDDWTHLDRAVAEIAREVERRWPALAAPNAASGAPLDTFDEAPSSETAIVRHDDTTDLRAP